MNKSQYGTLKIKKSVGANDVKMMEISFIQYHSFGYTEQSLFYGEIDQEQFIKIFIKLLVEGWKSVKNIPQITTKKNDDIEFFFEQSIG